MRRIKTYVRPTMLTERLSSLSVLHAYKHCDLDTEKIIDNFALNKKRRLAFLFSTQTDWIRRNRLISRMKTSSVFSL